MLLNRQMRVDKNQTLNKQSEIRLSSALFPFELTDLNSFHYGAYVLENVFGEITEVQQNECIDLWSRNGVHISSEVAAKRAQEVCYMLRDNKTGNLIGVNTLYPENVPFLDRQFYFYRTFIEPGSRNSRLMIVGTAMASCYAKVHLSATGVSGVVSVSENPKLSWRGPSRILNRMCYEKKGQFQNKDVWLFEFESVSIIEASNS